MNEKQKKLKNLTKRINKLKNKNEKSSQKQRRITSRIKYLDKEIKKYDN